MSATSDLLFAYLKEVFFGTAGATLEVEKLDADFEGFAKGLMYFSHCFSQYNEYAKGLAQGDLSIASPPPENELAAPLKSLHASLRHLTWQSQQVAKGDYSQRVDFMGDFSVAFNTMIEQLAERQKSLEEKITQSIVYASALEQINIMLSILTQYIPMQIFVVNAKEQSVLLQNGAAKIETDEDPGYLDRVIGMLPELVTLSGRYQIDFQADEERAERHLAVNTYQIHWNGVSAVALVIADVSEERRKVQELERHAYRDALTFTYNRFYGMLVLDEWLAAKKLFVIVFADLDNLKYVNDVFGHSEGDEYIIRAARYLQSFHPDAVLCRLGGDEFMLLVPDKDHAYATSRMHEVEAAVEGDERARDKGFSYSLSYGIVGVGSDNELQASTLLSIADERMYEHKRARKKERRELKEKDDAGQR